jgi:hypothetical protein
MKQHVENQYLYYLYFHSVFSATLLLSITALFREPKPREDSELDYLYLLRLHLFRIIIS